MEGKMDAIERYQQRKKWRMDSKRLDEIQAFRKRRDQRRKDADDENWITMNGTPVKVEKGQSAAEAGKAFAEKKEAARGENTTKKEWSDMSRQEKKADIIQRASEAQAHGSQGELDRLQRELKELEAQSWQDTLKPANFKNPENERLGLVGNEMLNSELKENFADAVPHGNINDFALKFMNNHKPGTTRITPDMIYTARDKGEITYKQMQLLENMTGIQLGYKRS